MGLGRSEHGSVHLKQQAGKAATAINKISGKVNPALGSSILTAAFGTDLTPAMEAVKPFSHLLIIQPLKTDAKPYYFNLDTAAFEELTRSTEFRWASQERLTRRPAQQAIGMGNERITLKGAIYPGFKGGLKQLDTLCQNYYGHLKGTVQAVLDANQALADEVQPYRAGVVIHLPDVVGRVRRG